MKPCPPKKKLLEDGANVFSWIHVHFDFPSISIVPWLLRNLTQFTNFIAFL